MPALASFSPGAARADISIPRLRSPTRCASAGQRSRSSEPPTVSKQRSFRKRATRCTPSPSRPLARELSSDAVAPSRSTRPERCEAMRSLLRLRPDVLVATGGYVCFPAVLAARVLRALRLSRMAIALLEPNAKPGLTNRMLAPLVDEVWGAFADADRGLPAKYVGPASRCVRRCVPCPTRDAAIAASGLDPARKTHPGDGRKPRSADDQRRGDRARERRRTAAGMANPARHR